MADRQQVIILHCALSVKYALHQNINSRLRFTEETYQDLHWQEKLGRERQKLTLFFVMIVHMAGLSFRERSLWMRPSNLINNSGMKIAELPEIHFNSI